MLVIIKAIAESWVAGYSSRPYKPLPHRLRMATRVACRAAASPRQTLHWLSWLRRQKLDAFQASNPLLPIKPLRPYIASDWSIDRRIGILSATIDFMRLRRGVFGEVLAGRTVLLARFDVPGMPDVSVRLAPCATKEGELTLFVSVAGFDDYVARAMFSFERLDADRFAMRVGCVQGNRNYYELDRNMEKAMHGLRPKALVVFALQELCRGSSVVDIFGVNQERHVFLKKHALSKLLGKRVRVLQMNYDALWQEAQGVRQDDGWFRLPIEYCRRPKSDMKSSKRSMYRKRFQLLDEVSGEIRSSIALMAPQPLPVAANDARIWQSDDVGTPSATDIAVVVAR